MATTAHITAITRPIMMITTNPIMPSACLADLAGSVDIVTITAGTAVVDTTVADGVAAADITDGTAAVDIGAIPAGRIFRIDDALPADGQTAPSGAVADDLLTVQPR